MTYQVSRLVRNSLATLYPKERETRRLTQDAGLNEISIEFSDRAIDNWHEILGQAQKHNKIETILNVVASEYRENPQYLCARLAYIVNQAMIETSTALTIYHHNRSWELRFDQSIKTLDDILEDLWERMHLLNGWLPLIDYIERLACIAKLAPIAAEHLRDWVNLAAPLILPGTTKEHIDKRRAQIISEVVNKKNKTDKPNYLSVEIVPAFGDPTRSGAKLYNIEILFWRDAQQEPSWRSENELSVPFDDIADLIDELLDDYSYEWEENPLIIEFILPNTLFLHAVDQLERPRMRVKGVRLGMDYPVIIRSLQRLEKGSRRRVWEDKWQYFHEHIKEKTINEAFWLCACDEYEPRVLRSKLLEETTIPCLAMTFTFSKAPAEDNEFFAAILEAGIPVAFWLRPCDYAAEQSEKIKEKIQHICADERLGNLPWQLQKTRSRSVVDNSLDLSNHLTLLWDDPTRIPEKYKKPQRFQAPKIKQ